MVQKIISYKQIIDYASIYEKATFNKNRRQLIFNCTTTEEIYRILELSELKCLEL